MSTYPGSVPVGGFFAPTDTSDVFPVTDSRFNLGGHHEVTDSTERDAIPSARRREGMTCYTQSDRKTWQLQSGILNINWIDITGTGGAGGTGDLSYTHNQVVASSVWSITHNLGKYPSVTIYDSANNIVLGDITYTDTTQLTVSFTAQFGGKAFLN